MISNQRAVFRHFSELLPVEILCRTTNQVCSHEYRKWEIFQSEERVGLRIDTEVCIIKGNRNRFTGKLFSVFQSFIDFVQGQDVEIIIIKILQVCSEIRWGYARDLWCTYIDMVILQYNS